MRSVGYESNGKVLEVEFQSGVVYQYSEVPESLYEELMRAGSKGRYFNDEIRDEFRCVRMGRARRAAKS